MNNRVNTPHDLVHLFPHNESEILARTQKIIQRVTEAVNGIIALPDTQRSFVNTARALDTVFNDISIESALFQTMMLVSPDESIRNAAQNAYVQLSSCAVDMLTLNKELYKTLKTYAEHTSPHESLSSEEQYYLTEILKDFKRNGLIIPSSVTVTPWGSSVR